MSREYFHSTCVCIFGFPGKSIMSSCACSSNGGCCQLASDLLLDFAMLCNARRLLNDLHARGNHNLYWYRFSCNPTCPTERMPGVCRHSADIAYVFGTVSNYASRTTPNCTWNQESRTFSRNVIDHWINMAATGRPLASWKPYSPNDPNYFDIAPDRAFATRSWLGDCKLPDEINAKGVQLNFGGTL